jgi:hypothetical protein
MRPGATVARCGAGPIRHGSGRHADLSDPRRLTGMAGHTGL